MEDFDNIPLKVYSEKDISLGTFFGGPLASGILIYRNYKTFGKEDSARNALYLGFSLSILLVFIISFLPESIPDKLYSFIMPILYTVIVHFIIQKYQKRDIEEYLSKGVPKASAWGAFGIGIMCSVIYFAIIISIVFLSSPDFDDKKYDNYVTVFVNNEKAALYIYEALQNQPVEKVISIIDESITLWDKNIDVIESMEDIEYLPDVLKEQDKLLFRYCGFRIEEMNLIKQAVTEGTNKYDSLIIAKQDEIKSVLDVLESYK